MQYKTLIEPSFLILMMEVQEHLRAGWQIDENNYPTANFTFYEVHLIREEHQEAIKEVFSENSFPDGEIFNTVIVPEAPKKQAGRPPRVKQ